MSSIIKPGELVAIAHQVGPKTKCIIGEVIFSDDFGLRVALMDCFGFWSDADMAVPWHRCHAIQICSCDKDDKAGVSNFMKQWASIFQKEHDPAPIREFEKVQPWHVDRYISEGWSVALFGKESSGDGGESPFVLMSR